MAKIGRDVNLILRDSLCTFNVNNYRKQTIYHSSYMFLNPRRWFHLRIGWYEVSAVICLHKTIRKPALQKCKAEFQLGPNTKHLKIFVLFTQYETLVVAWELFNWPFITNNSFSNIRSYNLKTEWRINSICFSTILYWTSF